MTISRMNPKKPRDWPTTGRAEVASLPETSTCDKHLYLPEYKTLDEVTPTHAHKDLYNLYFL